MRVEVRLYGALRRYRPVGVSETGNASHLPFEIDLPPDATVDLLAGRLGIPEGFVSAAAVNDMAVESTHALANGDRISFFPPSAGGGGTLDKTMATLVSDIFVRSVDAEIPTL